MNFGDWVGVGLIVVLILATLAMAGMLVYVLLSGELEEEETPNELHP